ncbi:hypothetical protein G9A89_021012 [Geosiphon pyriformis]|nr:hypothetical protein G9A89_021012 [Geosiphon pyriformis]
MKKVVKESGFGRGFKPVLSRKKKKDVTLKNGVGNKKVLTKVSSSHFWSSETSNTTRSKSINIEEEYLVEKTSFDYDKGGTIINGDYDHTLKEPSVKITKLLGKPLGKINFSNCGDDDDVLLDTFLELSPSLRNLVTVSVRKSFALDIGLDKVVEKFFQEKLIIIRKLFSKVNGFGETSTPSKFVGIIRATFTSEISLVQTSKKAEEVKILVNTNLKKLFGHSDWAVVVKKILIGTSAKAVCAVLSKYNTIVSIKIQLVDLWQKVIVKFGKVEQTDLVAACWSILIKKDTVYIARADQEKNYGI